MARYTDIDEEHPYPVEPDPTAPQDTTLFHGGLTLVRTDPDGKRVYQGADGTMWTDDPNMASESGFVPYAAPTAGRGDPTDTGTGSGTGTATTTTSGAFDYTPTAAPTFQPPGYTPPPAFDYQAFVAPTGADVLNDPGYAFRLKQGEQALLNNRAARGVLNTGGTLKDFLGYNQNFASQEYGNAWARAADAYRTNRENALMNYNTNYQTQYKDPYTFNYTSALDTFGPQFDAWKIGTDAAAHGRDQENYYRWVMANA